MEASSRPQVTRMWRGPCKTSQSDRVTGDTHPKKPPDNKNKANPNSSGWRFSSRRTSSQGNKRLHPLVHVRPPAADPGDYTLLAATVSLAGASYVSVPSPSLSC